MFVCCEAIGTCCEECSTWMTKTCKCLCPTDAPSPIFSIFSCLINLAIVAVAIAFLAMDGGKSCSTGAKCQAWYGVFIPIAIMNGVFAWYVYRRFASELQKGKSGCKSFTKFILYDVGCYIYIWVYIFEIVWLAIGPSAMCGDETVCTQLGNTSAAVALLATYIGAGVFFFLVSVTVQCCYEDTNAAARAAGNQPAHPSSMGGMAIPYNAAPPPHHQQPPPQKTGFFGGSSSSNNNNASYHGNQHQHQQQDSSVAGAIGGAIANAAKDAVGSGFKKLGESISGGNSSNNTSSSPQQQSGYAQPAYAQQPQPVYQQQQPQPQAVYAQPAAAAASPPQNIYTPDNKAAAATPQGGSSAQPQWL